MTQDFPYWHDGRALLGQIARPAEPGPHPAVLVMHSALGLGDVERSRAEDLAELGYLAVATDMYGEGRRLSKEESGERFVELVANPDLLRARVTAAFDAVCALPDVDSARVGAIGFCFGGQCALELARSGVPVCSAVSLHGLLRTATPARLGAVSAKVLSISGAKDPYVPAEDVQAFQQEMTDAGAHWQVTVYGEGLHAFTSPDIAGAGVPGTAYDPLLDQLSWAQTTAFLAATCR